MKHFETFQTNLSLNKTYHKSVSIKDYLTLIRLTYLTISDPLRRVYLGTFKIENGQLQCFCHNPNEKIRFC